MHAPATVELVVKTSPLPICPWDDKYGRTNWRARDLERASWREEMVVLVRFALDRAGKRWELGVDRASLRQKKAV